MASLAGLENFSILLVKINLDATEKNLGFDESLKESILIYKELVVSVCIVDDHSQLVQLSEYCNDLLLVQNWVVIRRTAVFGDYRLETHLKLPGFNVVTFPFLVVQSKFTRKSDCFELLNVNTGRLSPLITGTANSMDCQQATFFTSHGPRKFDFNFCTIVQN